MSYDQINQTSRRQILQRLGGACAVSWIAGSASAASLPLQNTGLEHFGMTVPDPEAAANFYGRIFDPQLFKERDPPPRFYVKLGTGYLAFGGSKDSKPLIDHFCLLTEGYGQGELRKLFDAAAVPVSAGALGMATDPDGIRLQTLAVPGGLARTIVPASRITQEDPLFQAIGPEHMILHVTDLEKSTAYYRKLLGIESSRTKKPERVWFSAARTRIGLELAAAGEKPGIHHICLKVAGFDKKSATDKLKKIGVDVLANDENLIRFRDPNGFIMELRAE